MYVRRFICKRSINCVIDYVLMLIVSGTTKLTCVHVQIVRIARNPCDRNAKRTKKRERNFLYQVTHFYFDLNHDCDLNTLPFKTLKGIVT